MKLFRWAALAIALSPLLVPVSTLAEGRMVKIGKTSNGYPMFVDRQSINNKDFDIAVAVTSGGMEVYTLQYACSERRLQIVEVTTYSADGEKMSSSGASNSMPAYNPNTVGGKALQVVCHELGAVGF